MGILRMKVAVVGEATSGKSAFVQMALSGGVTFPKNYMMTIGADLSVKEVSVDMSTQVDMTIIDLAGQELYRKQAPLYLDGISAFLLVYDISNKTTFETCKKWVEMCRKANKDSIGFLIANKIDMSDKAEVSDSQAEIFCRSNNLTLYKASALRGVGINKPIEELAKMHVENFIERCRALEALR